jgi:hypothetical protein
VVATKSTETRHAQLLNNPNAMSNASLPKKSASAITGRSKDIFQSINRSISNQSRRLRMTLLFYPCGLKPSLTLAVQCAPAMSFNPWKENQSASNNSYGSTSQPCRLYGWLFNDALMLAKGILALKSSSINLPQHIPPNWPSSLCMLEYILL